MATSFDLQHMSDAELQEVFDQFDPNGNGKIFAVELSKVLSAMGFVVAPSNLNYAIGEIDNDKDGFISLPEFITFCRSGSSTDSDLRDAFDLFDQDKNGFITCEELHQVLNRLNMKYSMEDYARMIKSVDDDGDGNVNFEEFKKMMASQAPSNN